MKLRVAVVELNTKSLLIIYTPNHTVNYLCNIPKMVLSIGNLLHIAGVLILKLGVVRVMWRGTTHAIVRRGKA